MRTVGQFLGARKRQGRQDDAQNSRLAGVWIAPDGTTTDYEYDERNRMTTVIRKDTENDPNPRITTYDYYEKNLLKLKTLPNGMVTSETGRAADQAAVIERCPL